MKTKILLLLILLVATFLRLWKLESIPVSLFGDELDVGYHALSILKTGKDYSGNPWPLHFHSLAEWRTPLFIYSTVPTVAIFGISSLGVRLPAAVFGILGVFAIYLLTNQLTNNKSLSSLASLLLALSPWHIQYSRAGFEVTLLLLLLLLGLYFFFKAIQKSHPERLGGVEGSRGKWLWLSSVFLALTPWVYSTAKLFTPMLLIFLLFVWRKEILIISKKQLVFAFLALVVIGGPIAYSTLYGGGTQRFGYISIFTDPTTEPEVGNGRLIDARVRGELGEGLRPTFLDRAIHNKFTFWGENILKNYLESFSTEFLFIKGDLNLRHSIGMGQLYKVEAIALVLGIILFFSTKNYERRTKLFIIFWILAGVVPAAITREGGRHATRLILILPPLLLLMAQGIKSLPKLFLSLYALAFLVNFGFYLHEYYVHYPWKSERWWHAGYKEAIQSAKSIEGNYDKVIITSASEPPWIFFAGWYEYDPNLWHQEFPIGNDVEVTGFGKISHTGKFYFGSPQGGLYDWGKLMDTNTVYVASEKEVKVNLIREPERTPQDLTLLKAIAYPSGEPAFYLFAKK